MADVYISPTGNDTTGSGTSGAPWLTISKAYTSSASGDTIHCAAGTYTLVSQTFTSARTVVGDAGAATTIFDGGAVIAGWLVATSLAVTGITMQNAVRPTFGNILEIDGGSAATIIATNCIFKDLTTAAARGLFGKNNSSANGGSLTMIGCLINNCNGPGTGVAYFGVNAFATSFVIYNCTFYSNVADTPTPNFFDNVGGGSPAVNFDLRNNIVVNANGTPKAWNGGGAGGVTFTGTVAASNDTLGYTSLPSGLSGSISADPLFVNAAGGNFNLRPGSPAIDAGVII